MAFLETGGQEWVLSNIGNHLRATPVDAASTLAYAIELDGFIRDIELVAFNGRAYALIAMGSEGLAAVDVTLPRAMRIHAQVRVNYFQDGLTWTEGGGAIVHDNTIEGTHGNVSSLVSDGVNLWIGNEDYGLHRAPLAKLITANGPVLEPDGTLEVEDEAFTLQYAGENPWGGPLDLNLVDGRLFVSMGFLGLGIFDPVTLEQVGGYNHYTDTSVVEDWFLDMDVAQEVQPGLLDSFTGMPDYRQASFEILRIWHGGLDQPTPWADFDRYGKWYYNARRSVVADWGQTSIAYIAYGLAGAVAVDVTGFRDATPSDFLRATYLGYAPGVPAHGPEEPTMRGGGPGSQSLFPHFGAGLLKEAGVADVAIVGTRLYFSDHFAGLTILKGAYDPANFWHGGRAPYDNDDPNLGDGILGDHWPDYEWVTSYDMSPSDPLDEESLPIWMYRKPSLLVTGEVGGHGNVFITHPDIEPQSAGRADVLMCVGSGGFEYFDIIDLTNPRMENRFGVLKALPTTDELGASPEGPLVPISIGHTQGVLVSRNHLYVADGPHGVTAWKILNDDGSFADRPHVVANTLQLEGEFDYGGVTWYPTPHAYGLVYDEANDTVLTMCQGRGVRRLDVANVEAGLGQPGSPLLLSPGPRDIFEHNTETGSVDGTPKQDHAYDAKLLGNLLFVADGGNGLTVYDLTKDPTDLQSGFVVDNLGGSAQGKAELGRSTGIALWVDPATMTRYAFMAAGPRGVGVVDVSDPADLKLVKVFEPIKIEDGQVGHADGRAVDVIALRDHAYFSYDSFGIVCYSTADLIEPLPDGVDPTEIWKVQGGSVLFDYRPEAKSRFVLDEVPGYEEEPGGALGMNVTRIAGAIYFHVAYGVSGLALIHWRDPAHPELLELLPTPGEAAAVTVFRGRRYVADTLGGLMCFE